uniref:Uncharacterized protein n=1 Tax=Phlebotomus papatasi TaxID=29031 RepID=A0A1B0DAJ7_PHLPP
MDNFVRKLRGLSQKTRAISTNLVRSVMHKYLEKENEISFDKIFNQILGYLLFKDFCENVSEEPVPHLKFYEQIKNYEKTECHDERRKLAREIYDNFIMKEMLSHTHEYSKEAVSHVQKYLMKNEVPVNLFESPKPLQEAAQMQQRI